MINRRNIVTRLLACMLFFCLAFTSAGFSIAGGQSFAAASGKKASDTKISDSKLKLNTGQSKTLKVKKASSGVIWISSNKKVAYVTNKRGKRGSVITVKAKKAGKCTITAKIGKKRYKCRVTVSKNKQLSSSSVLKTTGYKYNRKLGANGTNSFNYAVADFSFDLLDRVTAESASAGNENILISPDSILTAMIMVENGAKGQTLKEMETVLTGGISIKDFNKYLAGLNGRLCSSDKMIYQQANSIWVKKNTLKVKKAFVKKNKQYHNAEFYEAPFNSKTVKDINNWVYNNSRYMIRKIVNRLDSDHRMVLVNTTAFEGTWIEPFRVTRKHDFTLENKSTAKVDMMFDTGMYRQIKLDGGQGFARVYIGDDQNHQIAFVGILPPEDMSVEDYINGITGKEFIKAWKNAEFVNMEIGLPKFTYDYSTSLEQALSAMGIKQAFTPAADFSGIATTERLHIDSILHKTHIEVDEKGTKAAAATAIMEKASAMMDKPEQLYLDRPFLYALVDTKTGIPLFTGIIRKP